MNFYYRSLLPYVGRIRIGEPRWDSFGQEPIELLHWLILVSMLLRGISDKEESVGVIRGADKGIDGS